MNDISVFKEYLRYCVINNAYENKLTGLIESPDITGFDVCYNWTTYYCIRYKSKYFPVEIMNIINVFLNWTPAGLWYNKYDVCSVCGMYTPIINSDYFMICSLYCEEKDRRYTTTEFYYDKYIDDMNRLMHLIKNNCRNEDIDTEIKIINNKFIGRPGSYYYLYDQKHRYVVPSWRSDL